jgi:archaeoflavoprotein AfpA
MVTKIAWGITGSGDHLEESVKIMKVLRRKHALNVDVILSRAGETVVTWYKLWGTLKQNFNKVFVERTPNSPFLVGPLQLGKYKLLLVCPATANTAAKVAHGIADSLLTNCVAQAMKAGIPVYMFPVDQMPGEVETCLPDGRRLRLVMRDVDVENAERLKQMKGLKVLSSPKDIESILRYTH